MTIAPEVFNPDQMDADEDGIGDLCESPMGGNPGSGGNGGMGGLPADSDRDEDGATDDVDNCPDEYNPVDPELGTQPPCTNGMGGQSGSREPRYR